MRAVSVVTLVLIALSACKPPAEPIAKTTPPADAPPMNSKEALGGNPPANPKPATGPVDFEKAIKLDVTFDKARGAVVVKVHLEPGFHAYGPGEQTGKPLNLEVTGDGWTLKNLAIPKGEEKDLGDLGKSVVVTGDVEIVGTVEAKDAKKPVEGIVRYQVCSDKNCDRPRTLPFKLPAA